MQGSEFSITMYEFVSSRANYLQFSVEGIDCGDAVADWLSKVLKKPSRLLRKRPNYNRKGQGTL